MIKILKKCLGIYENMSAPVKSSIWFTICSVVQKAITLLSTPIFTRLLTTEQYGEYTVYQSWYQILTVFATLNLAAGVFNNGLLKYEKSRNEFTSSMQGLSTTVTGGLFLLYLCAMDFWNELMGLSTLYVVAMFVELLFVPAYHFWSKRERFSYRYKKLIVTTIIIAFGSPMLALIAVLNTTYKAEARVLSYVLVQVGIGLVFYVYNAVRGKKFFDKEIWKFALGFNIPLIPHYLAFSMLNQADRIMIDKMVGTGQAAIYGVAYSVSMIMNIVTTAINNSFIPYTYKAIRDKKFEDIRKNTNVLLLIVGAGCILAMAFAPEIIKIFASESYYEAIWIMPPLAASVYFMFLYPLFGNIEFYFEKTKFVTIASCTGAVANVILNYIFIGKYGYLAAGYTTLICYILFSFAHYVFHKKVIRQKLEEIQQIYDIKFMLIFSGILLLIMFGMTMIYEYIVIRYGIIALILFVAFVKRQVLISKLKEIRGGR
ncbi:MAG: oligosaccharide flippase family protein [Lachnospiraceae bacterium]|nr:oligosaccharide flippase family protein [Lachnospiraceae bacterium]